jgi:hypothetical protein
MNNGKLAIFGLPVALILAAAIASSCTPVQHPGPKAETSAIITECVIGIMRHESRHRITAGEELGPTNESSEINRVIAGWFQGDTRVSNYVRFSSNSPLLLVDGWGTPLNFVQRSRVDSRYSTGLLAITNSVLVWSSGANLSNEYGNGDDVIFDTNGTIRAQTLGTVGNQ